MEGTHFLESQDRHHEQGQNAAHHRTALTNWRAEDSCCKQTECSPPQKPLTCWRAKDRHCEQGPNPAQHGSHSLSEKTRTGVMSRDKMQLTTEPTHKLESQGQAL